MMMENLSKNILSRLMRVFFYLLYNQMAWSYDHVAALVSWGRWGDWIMTVLPFLTGPRILELGHGPGHLQVALNQRDIQVIGVDASRQMSQQARKRLLKTDFTPLLTCSKAQKLPFIKHHFDQIVATFPTEYIYSHDTLREIYRILKPDGTLIVLPVAWITGKRAIDRFTSSLFQITGQSPNWDPEWLSPFNSVGFNTETKMVIRPSWSLTIIVAYKPE